MSDLADILKILIPSGIVFLTAYFMLKNFMESQSKMKELDSKNSVRNLITPVRLQAYERITLFLERISPNSLVMRVHKNGMSSLLLQSELVKTIRSEFEHNLSQQIYISDVSWQLVKTSKEEIIKLINLSASQMSDTSTGLELAQTILRLTAQLKKVPTDIALEYLKKEISQSF
jgi:hypothetical protein